MAQTPQRGGVRDLNAERAAEQGRNQMVQAVDTFAPVQSTVFGQTQVQGNRLLSSLAKFGTEIGAVEMEKQAKANFLQGQTMRAAGEEMAEGVAPPTRRGYKAMDAKIKTQEWYAEQKRMIDEGENEIDPLEYGSTVAGRIKGMLTGDRELDSMITEAALPLVSELGRYQTDANVKRRRADAIAQTTADVTGSIRLLKEAQKTGDVKGEANARTRMLNALKMPVISDPALRQQTYADVAALGLDMGDPTALNYVRDQGIQFSPEQERKLLAAETRYTTNKRGELDTAYQYDLADLEAGISTASSVLEVREMAAQFQEQWPERKTNDYFASLEGKWRAAKNKNMLISVRTEDYQNGDLAKVPGMTNKQHQEVVRTVEAEIENNPELTPEQKERQKQSLWSDNNVVHDDKKTRWDAGFTNPFNDDGTVNPDFEATYSETVSYYRKNPDLAMKHLSAENRAKFKNIYNLSEYGGMALRDAAAMVRTNKENARELTSDERTDMRKRVTEEVDTVMGKGFFNARSWTDAIGVTTPIRNEGMVRERITRLSETYMQTGYTDPEAAVEAARIKIMETHEQVGDSLIYNGGQSLASRMNIGDKQLEGAIEYQKNAILEANPDFDGDNLVLMGDPLSNALMFGNLNENGVISDVVSVDLQAAGAAYHADVLVPKDAAQLREMGAAEKEQARKMKLMEEAVNTGIYTEQEAEAALSNWLGSFVLESRVDAAIESEQEPLRADLRDQALASGTLQQDVATGKRTQEEVDRLINTMIDTKLEMDRNEEHLARKAMKSKVIKEKGLRSDEEFESWKRTRDATRNQNTPEQQRLLEAGKLDEYQLSRNPDLPKTPRADSPEAFAEDALMTTRALLADTEIFPEVAAAQAALESGWGSSVKGNNYFGIKGDGQKFMTHEIIDGKRVNMVDNFRKFNSFPEAVQGFRDFLYENPRYKRALAAESPEEQARALQEAGYATDPEYAEKLISIMNQPRFK